MATTVKQHLRIKKFYDTTQNFLPARLPTFVGKLQQTGQDGDGQKKQ